MRSDAKSDRHALLRMMTPRATTPLITTGPIRAPAPAKFSSRDRPSLDCSRVESGRFLQGVDEKIVKRKVGTLIEEKVIRLAKRRTADEGRSLSQVTKHALLRFLNQPEARPEDRHRAYAVSGSGARPGSCVRRQRQQARRHVCCDPRSGAKTSGWSDVEKLVAEFASRPATQQCSYASCQVSRVSSPGHNDSCMRLAGL